MCATHMVMNLSPKRGTPKYMICHVTTYEQPAGVGLNRVLADKKLFSNLTIAQTAGNQFEYL